jgi:uncharacterized membrane protein YjfL (UPF0719 family)
MGFIMAGVVVVLDAALLVGVMVRTPGPAGRIHAAWTCWVLALAWVIAWRWQARRETGMFPGLEAAVLNAGHQVLCGSMGLALALWAAWDGLDRAALLPLVLCGALVGHLGTSAWAELADDHALGARWRVDRPPMRLSTINREYDPHVERPLALARYALLALTAVVAAVPSWTDSVPSWASAGACFTLAVVALPVFLLVPRRWPTSRVYHPDVKRLRYGAVALSVVLCGGWIGALGALAHALSYGVTVPAMVVALGCLATTAVLVASEVRAIGLSRTRARAMPQSHWTSPDLVVW